MKNTCLIKMISLLTLFAGLYAAQAQKRTAASANFEHEVVHNQEAAIKIVHIHDRPILQGTINGKKAYFLLDTGASISMLHTDKARHYDFVVRETRNPAMQVTVQNFHGRRIETQSVGNAKLILGELPIRTSLYAFDLSPVIRNVKARTNYTISGIIGADVMRRYRFLIDFHNRQIAYTK